MPISAGTLKLLVDAGLSGETLVRVVASIDADAASKSRSSGAERQARYRQRKASNVTRDVTGDASRPSPKESPPRPPKEITPSPVEEAIASPTESAREFAEFWQLYPNKTGKPVALKAFVKARRGAPFGDIMAGLRRYIASKPADRAWLNPATFLNQERWADQPAGTSLPGARASPAKPTALNVIDNLRNKVGAANGQPRRETERDPRLALGFSGNAR